MPDRVTTVGLVGALLMMVTLPGRGPVAVGRKLPVKVQLPPGATGAVQPLLPV